MAAGAQSLEHGALHRRLVLGLGCRTCCPPRAGEPRLRYRRLDARPAGLCGIAGLKPTYGRLSRYGLVAFGSSLDQVGVFARHAGDVALAYETLAGPDPFDATARPGPPPGTQDRS